MTSSYERALHSHSTPEVAISMYSDILNFIASLEHIPSSTTRKVMYLSLKNLAQLEARFGPPLLEDALQHFTEALDVDGTDCIVWYEAGCISYRLQKWSLSRMLLEKAFNIDSTFWPTVHKLMNTLYIIGDEHECLRLVQHILTHDSSHRVATALQYLITNEIKSNVALPDCEEAVSDLVKCRLATQKPSPQVNPSKVVYELTDPSWEALGCLLLEIYDSVQNGVTNDAFQVPAFHVPVHIQLNSVIQESKNNHTKLKESQDDKTCDSIHVTNVSEEHDVSPPQASLAETTVIQLNQHETDVVPLEASLDESKPSSPSSNSRRTSHRTLKRIQDEQQAALRFAIEKDVSYRLMAFLNVEHEETPSSLFDSPTIVKISDNRKYLSIIRDGNENKLVLLGDMHESLHQNQSEEEPLNYISRKSVFNVSSFLTSFASGDASNKGIEDVMINFVELCAENYYLKLDEGLLDVILWMNKCIHEELVFNLPLTALPKKLSPKARLYILEIEVDQLVSHFDPLCHSHFDHTASLHHKQCLLDQIKMENDVDALLTRILWLQVQLDERLRHFERTNEILDELEKRLSGDIRLANVQAFPALTHESITAKKRQLSFASLATTARNLFQMEEKEKEIVDLLLPHYDPDLGRAGHIEDLVKDFRICLIHSNESWPSDGDASKLRTDAPLLKILLKCLCRRQSFDKCFQVLVLCLFYALEPLKEESIPDRTTVQCVNYIIAQLYIVVEKPLQRPEPYTELLDFCCFACRDSVLKHYHSSKLLLRMTRLVSPLHVVRFVGKILQDSYSIRWNLKPNQETMSTILTALEQINRRFSLSMSSSERLIDAGLAKSLSAPIAHLLKHQIEAGKYNTMSRHLLYASCSAFALVWNDIHKGKYVDCADLVRLLHEMMTAGDGLQGQGVCALSYEGYNFLEIAKYMLLQSDEDVECELAQCYFCLYGYGLLSSCQNHHGDEAPKRTKDEDHIMELFDFCQKVESKLVRKESAVLFENVLDLPDTKSILQSLVPSSDFQSTLSKYMNPIASNEVHKLSPLSWKNVEAVESNSMGELWFELATNFILPKVKRRGRDYTQLLDYESQCFKYVSYLRNDIFLHPGRAESYHLMASCLKSLRTLVVDHWIVAWLNYKYPQSTIPIDLSSHGMITFEEVTANSFFGRFIAWIEDVQKAGDDETSQQEVIYKSREMSLFYSRYVSVLGELTFRCYDMAAALDLDLAGECYEDAGYLAWNMISEKLQNGSHLCLLAKKYFELGLQNIDGDDAASFRLNYMLGKTVKKHQKTYSGSPHAWQSILEYFHRAETHRQNAELESLPHAFYHLHACRLKLLLGSVDKTGAKQSYLDLTPSPEVLQLVNLFFYKKSNKSSETSAADLEISREAITIFIQREDTRWIARQHLLWNCLDALENIPQEDRYFHPAYYMYAWGLKVGRVLMDNSSEKWHERFSISTAIKAMKPLFDRKRHQVVAIWLSESETHKLEELHQRQSKYDRLRLKYFSFYLDLLTMAGDSQRVSDLTSWVITSKEEHWVIDAMLLQALGTSSYLARGKLLDLYLKCLFPGQEESNFQQRIYTHLNRTYSVYMEYNEAWHRVRTSNEQSMGNCLWEVAMSYALYIVIHDQHVEWCDQAVAHVEKQLINYSQSVATGHENLLFELYQELKMEEQPYWPTLVDEALNFCSLKWPDKTKPKGKPPVPRSKLRFLSN
ncbi:unnamed protein product [Aphanomyces euteiches]